MMEWVKLLNPQRPGQKSTNTKAGDARTLFEQDYDRIIFSYPFRCLQDKTQVFPLAKTEFVHNRLTHSLEVSSVGRSLGKQTGKVIAERESVLKKSGFSEFEIGAIVAAASLAHDIGNPPFGHSGEEAISEFFIHDPYGQSLKEHYQSNEWADLTQFEGNAQGFRLLTKDNYQGLRITYATLAAFTKYPRGSNLPEADTTRKSQKKYGFFDSEKEKFSEVAENTGLISFSKEGLCWCRHPLAFLVEAADDICYSIIDLEDGCNLGLVSVNETKELLADILGVKFDNKKFNSIPDKREKVSLLRAMVISELVDQVCFTFLDVENEILDGKFDMALTSCIPSTPHLKNIIGISIDKIYRSTAVLEKETAGFEVLSGLINAYLQAIDNYYQTGGHPSRKNSTIISLFPDEILSMLKSKDYSFYHTTLACLDHLSLMTDTLALSIYRKIKGISISGI